MNSNPQSIKLENTCQYQTMNVSSRIARLKNNKAALDDGLPAELSCGEELKRTACNNVFVKCDDWNQNVVCPIYKKMDSGLGQLFLDLALQCHMEGLVERFVWKIKAHRQRTGRSTINQLYVISQTSENSSEMSLDILVHHHFAEFKAPKLLWLCKITLINGKREGSNGAEDNNTTCRAKECKTTYQCWCYRYDSHKIDLLSAQ